MEKVDVVSVLPHFSVSSSVLVTLGKAGTLTELSKLKWGCTPARNAARWEESLRAGMRRLVTDCMNTQRKDFVEEASVPCENDEPVGSIIPSAVCFYKMDSRLIRW